MSAITIHGIAVPDAFIDACLEHLTHRQQVLVLYFLRQGWVAGYGLSPYHLPSLLAPVLSVQPATVAGHLRALVAVGALQAQNGGRQPRYSVALDWRGPA